MDFQSDNNFNEQLRPPVQPQDAMITASIILSIIALMTTCCIYSSLVCGSLSIVLALLARGRQKKLTPQGKLAVTISIIAIALAMIATVAIFIITIREYGSLENFLKAYSELAESLTGMSLSEMLE